MSQQELLKRVVEVLAAAGIDYMATGSIASSMQGAPRATHDIDLVVSVPPSAVKPLVQAFPGPDFLLQEETIVEALRNRSMFNLLDLTGGDKVDFWILTDDPFDRSRFSRKRVDAFQGFPLWVSAPEDTILVKLRWAQLSGGSEKQFTDALQVYEMQHKVLDRDYLNAWVKPLGVEDLWKRLQAEAEPL
jgi:hypothetical protein